MKYEFIKMNFGNFDIMRMCPVLGVSRSGYYAWLRRPKSKRAQENEILLEKIKIIHQRSKAIYGSPKIREELKTEGVICGNNRVARLMKENNIRSKIVKKFRNTKKSLPETEAFQNVLDRKFQVSEPNRSWVSDITYIWTKQGWVYLCIVLDLFSRKIIGWSVSENMGSDLVISAILIALRNRKIKKGLIFHSDRGVQYSSNVVVELLKRHHIMQSMSRKGNCWDNACSETFFHLLKSEELDFIELREIEQTRVKIFEYIEVFYNRTRIHSYLGYMSPVNFEKKLIG